MRATIMQTVGDVRIENGPNPGLQRSTGTVSQITRVVCWPACGVDQDRVRAPDWTG